MGCCTGDSSFGGKTGGSNECFLLRDTIIELRFIDAAGDFESDPLEIWKNLNTDDSIAAGQREVVAAMNKYSFKMLIDIRRSVRCTTPDYRTLRSKQQPDFCYGERSGRISDTESPLKPEKDGNDVIYWVQIPDCKKLGNCKNAGDEEKCLCEVSIDTDNIFGRLFPGWEDPGWKDNDITKKYGEAKHNPFFVPGSQSGDPIWREKMLLRDCFALLFGKVHQGWDTRNQMVIQAQIKNYVSKKCAISEFRGGLSKLAECCNDEGFTTIKEGGDIPPYTDPDEYEGEWRCLKPTLDECKKHWTPKEQRTLLGWCMPCTGENSKWRPKDMDHTVGDCISDTIEECYGPFRGTTSNFQKCSCTETLGFCEWVRIWDPFFKKNPGCIGYEKRREARGKK